MLCFSTLSLKVPRIYFLGQTELIINPSLARYLDTKNYLLIVRNNSCSVTFARNKIGCNFINQNGFNLENHQNNLTRFFHHLFIAGSCLTRFENLKCHSFFIPKFQRVKLVISRTLRKNDSIEVIRGHPSLNRGHLGSKHQNFQYRR